LPVVTPVELDQSAGHLNLGQRVLVSPVPVSLQELALDLVWVGIGEVVADQYLGVGLAVAEQGPPTLVTLKDRVRPAAPFFPGRQDLDRPLEPIALDVLGQV
jgi:hypothetical protein